MRQEFLCLITHMEKYNLKNMEKSKIFFEIIIIFFENQISKTHLAPHNTISPFRLRMFFLLPSVSTSHQQLHNTPSLLCDALHSPWSFCSIATTAGWTASSVTPQAAEPTAACCCSCRRCGRCIRRRRRRRRRHAWRARGRAGCPPRRRRGRCH